MNEQLFDALSDVELAALSEEAISQWVDYLCAERGIPFAEPTPERPGTEANEAAPDQTVFEVPSMMFERQADAEAVIALATPCLRWKSDYKYRRGTEARYEGSPDFAAVTLVMKQILRATAPSAKSDREEKAKLVQAAYDEIVERIRTVNDQRRDVVQQIVEKRQAATARLRRRAQYADYHARYLKLAGGRRDIAARFFEDAYQDAKETYPDAFENLYPDVAAIPAKTTRAYDEHEAATADPRD